MAETAGSRSDRRADLVEELGLLLEGSGHTRTAGRALAHLLLGGKAHQSQAELAEALDASLASVSVALRQLIQMELVERVNVRGARSGYYRASATGWSHHLTRGLPAVRRYVEVADLGLELLGDEASEPLEAMRDYFAFMEREIPALIKKFVEWRARESAA